MIFDITDVISYYRFYTFFIFLSRVCEKKGDLGGVGLVGKTEKDIKRCPFCFGRADVLDTTHFIEVFLSQFWSHSVFYSNLLLIVTSLSPFFPFNIL